MCSKLPESDNHIDNTINSYFNAGDYDVTATVHSDTYPEIDPAKLDLSGKAVLITGGSHGIGRAIVLA